MKSNLEVGISVSGCVSRTVEAVLMGREFGAVCMALTANPEGDAANSAQIGVRAGNHREAASRGIGP